ncbi:hypothetical protein GCM10011349_09340 [Novosphingobium indicum]|uniref:Type II toxin-antitoxin system VapB family antitoxin n=1 Tax=Novosphingobium indicum TaxID=462949 RepID=A0ABQ2JCY0_9SPHN|nr:type II toxin-antitoxin system VapB family antitoxin [Novosphingobium indicum]GGN44375.1 hypothetical protein GCM10011349_09340 [Novosphingobium indicum]
MRTNIVIDDDLVARAFHATGLKTKQEVVDYGFPALLKLRSHAQIRNSRGKLALKGDLDAMRSDT